VPIPSCLDSDTAALLALLAVAQDAADAVASVGTVEVRGRGVIALQVRALLAGRTSEGEAQPAAIVDTTGDPGVIVDATRRLAPLGTLVLAGEVVGRTVELNLYPDIHVRGLTLVGVTAPLQGGAPSVLAGAEDPLLAACRKELASATPGSPLPSDAAWYRMAQV